MKISTFSTFKKGKVSAETIRENTVFTADHFEKIYDTVFFFMSAHVPFQEMQILMTPIGTRH